MTETRDREYRFRPGWFYTVVLPLICGGAAGALAYAAATNDEGMRLYNAIDMPRATANAIFAFGAVFCGVVLLWLLWEAFNAFVRPQRVTLTDRALFIPKGGWSQVQIALPYAEVTDVQVKSIGRDRFLIVHHAGKKHSLAEMFLASRAEFDDLCRRVQAHVAAARGGS